MGYTTDFEGRFKLNKALDDKTYDFLKRLSDTRRMARDTDILKSMGYDGDYGVEGEFFVYGEGFAGQDRDDSIIDYNRPPITQPGLWCKWMPTEDRMHIEWTGEEKFYSYVEWLEYIIDKVLKPQGYSLNGEVDYQGEDFSDNGTIVIEDNLIILE